MRHQWIFVVMLAACLPLTGCHSSAASAAKSKRPAAVQHAGRLVVVGVDRTASWNAMTQRALTIAKNVLRQARPGDTLVFRWISDHSYQPSEQFTVVSLPRLATAGDVLDRRAKFAAARSRAKLVAAWKQGLAQLNNENPELVPALAHGTKATDIYGFIAAAADDFEADTHHRRHVLVLVTDLKDNRGQKFKPDLKGVTVIVHLLLHAGATPAATERRRQRWSMFLRSAGAVSVRILAAQETAG